MVGIPDQHSFPMRHSILIYRLYIDGTYIYDASLNVFISLKLLLSFMFMKQSRRGHVDPPLKVRRKALPSDL
jgi:hypothetical protein